MGSDRTARSLVDDAAARGAFSAAVLSVAIDGDVALTHATGTLRAWDSATVPARPEGAATAQDSLFDLASVTKPVVAAAMLCELHARGADHRLAAAELLPEFRAKGMRDVTVAQLLSHTAGFPESWPDHAADPRARRFRAGARQDAPPGARHRYSCIGYMWAGILLAELAGAPLDEVVRRRVLDPLGMTQTGYLPGPRLRERIAATEEQPQRGMVHGTVHDEAAWAIGGVSGNAGLFGTAADLLRFAEELRTGGVLPPAVVSALTEPTPVPGDPGYRQALGPRVDEAWMAPLGAGATGHTGFTGTSFVTRPGGDRSVVFLTNRVHPVRAQLALLGLRGPVTLVAAQLGARNE